MCNIYITQNIQFYITKFNSYIIEKNKVRKRLNDIIQASEYA